MIYAVYDKNTNKIIKSGIAASEEDCFAQLENEITQGIVIADTSEALATNTTALGLQNG